jgi:hypothetical protein
VKPILEPRHDLSPMEIDAVEDCPAELRGQEIFFGNGQ